MDMSVILIIVILLAFVAWASWNYWRVRRAAKFLDNESFQKEMSRGQLIDIREAGAFHRKHILEHVTFQQANLKLLYRLYAKINLSSYMTQAVVNLFQELFCYSEKKVLINFTY